MNFLSNKKIQHIIFDCDNILVNTDTVLISVILDVLEGQGIDMHPDKLIKLFGGLDIEDAAVILQKTCQTDFHEEFESELVRKFENEIFHGLESLPGVKKFLETTNCKISLLTSQDHQQLQRKLFLTGLHYYFDETNTHLTSEENYGDSLLALIEKNVVAPSLSLLIKDRPAQISASLKNGISIASSSSFPIETINNANIYHYEVIEDLHKRYKFT
ncbi:MULTISPECIES: HAD family hydrolase [Flavobacterium]|uniref:HAD family hydrolase n=1 Tax=Flavobacterium TaxID=237 RepID=UPI001181E96C|nr:MULTISPECIES: HAD hydrolase-like protein [Flavobacterium]MCR4030708.1 HAD hydrolase-like protein [Flavobacterium panacis]